MTSRMLVEHNFMTYDVYLYILFRGVFRVLYKFFTYRYCCAKWHSMLKHSLDLFFPFFSSSLTQAVEGNAFEQCGTKCSCE